jgi:hypothetical protein
MKKAPFLFGLTLATAVAAPAMADLAVSPTAGHANVDALIGGGFHDGFGFGLGARGGYTLPMNVYLGGSLIYFFGSSVGEFSYSVLSLGVEGGYDFYVSPVIIRPFLGLGPDFLMVSCPSSVTNLGLTCQGGDTRFAATLGAAVFYPFTENWFAGADMRVHIVSDFTNFQLFANGGYQF